MKNFIINNTNILWGFPTKGNCTILGQGKGSLSDILIEIYDVILIAVPILVIVLCTVDIAKAVIAQDEKDMKAAQAKAIKRLIIGVAIMFVPLLLDTILKLAGIGSGVCHIGI